MNKIISSIVIASCTVLAAPSAWACPPMHQGQPCGKHIDEMDANKDGSISKKEFDAFHNKHFKELDANHDGKISQEEMLAAYPGKMHERGDALISKRFDTADANHDGALTKEEAKDMPMLSKNFDEIDTNKDGKVTPEELKAMMEEHRATGGPGSMMMPEKK
ncbi:MAG: signal transduction protein with EFhand [Gallionellaceae bacterium]|nr:MAG: signal transduction protein with EFhand [Gallionellaceae bacterium]